MKLNFNVSDKRGDREFKLIVYVRDPGMPVTAEKYPRGVSEDVEETEASGLEDRHSGTRSSRGTRSIGFDEACSAEDRAVNYDTDVSTGGWTVSGVNNVNVRTFAR